MAMNKDNIVALPHSRLRQKSTKVSVFDDKLKQLVNDMQAAALDWEDNRQYELCVGLAAVQVDILKRIVIIRADLEDKTKRDFITLINPKIIKTYGQPVEEFYDGCLSVTDIYARVPRYPKVKIKAQDINGDEFRLTADGFLAVLIQHEIDHTKGVLFIDHIKDSPEAYYKISDDGKMEKLDYERDIKDSDILWQ